MYNDQFLKQKLRKRTLEKALRELKLTNQLIDFCSNDYLGIVHNNLLNNQNYTALKTGSTGSRLLAGNYSLIEETEQQIAEFHQTEEALIFNSGYDANLGVLSSIPQRGDIILYDALSHASIRDGIRLSFAQSFSFIHNDVDDLEKRLKQSTKGNVFVVTESVFSMDGDVCPLPEIVQLCKQYSAHLIVDEAHATGIIGIRGEGLVQQFNLQEDVFCRMHTFGKACGCHGAVVLGSKTLKNYLINFSRSFIYSTALPQQAIATIQKSYQLFPSLITERQHLQQLINYFQILDNKYEKLSSNTPIQAVIIPGNERTKFVASKLQKENLDVRAILYPTVPKGRERLRIVLHAFNTIEELQLLANVLQKN